MKFETNDAAAKLLQKLADKDRQGTMEMLAGCWNEIYWSTLDNKSYEECGELKYAGIALLTELVMKLQYNDDNK